MAWNMSRLGSRPPIWAKDTWFSDSGLCNLFLDPDGAFFRDVWVLKQSLLVPNPFKQANCRALIAARMSPPEDSARAVRVSLSGTLSVSSLAMAESVLTMFVVVTGLKVMLWMPSLKIRSAGKRFLTRSSLDPSLTTMTSGWPREPERY